MSQRRAIACTICAKAKTKCDKAVPSCSRCTAKGLLCEPRSTRRTSDTNYRTQKKQQIVKRYPSTNSIPNISRHSSPRSVPLGDRHQLVRAVSHMDFHTAVKLGQQRPDFASMSMLGPLQSYTPQIIDECYSSSPERSITTFSHQMGKNHFLGSGRLTPQTPESFTYNEPVSMVEPFDQYTNTWSNEAHMPVGLGFENDIPGLMPTEPDMRVWTSDFDGNSTPMGNIRPYGTTVCESPASVNVWPNTNLSVSPPQLPHTRAVPSLSISECSTQDFESPNAAQEEWSGFAGHAGEMATGTPNTTTAGHDNMKAIPREPQIWEDGVFTRMSSTWEEQYKDMAKWCIE